MTDDLDELLLRVRNAVGERYRVTRVIGRGGMATVYLADDVRHERPVAIKVLAPELGAIIGAERFLKEIKVTANLQHPHILGLIDSGEADGLLWYAMPFVDGESLRQRLEREKQLPVSDAVRIAREVGDALHHAHRQGIIHRDVKPENVLLRDGHALVADFGIALAASRAGGSRLTGTGLSLGTPSYMSPEQAQGDRELDARTDQYSLAAMTYEMLSGQPPHVGPTVQALMAGLLTREPELLETLRPTVPAHVAHAVHTGLAKLPADRFPTTGDFAAALTDPSRTDGFPSRTIATKAATRRTSPATIALAATAALIAGIGGGYALRGTTHLPETAPTFSFEIGPDTGLKPVSGWPLISFDGSALFYTASNGTSISVYVRPMGSLTTRRIAGSDSVYQSEFAVAADGRSILAVMPKGFRRIDIDGSSAVVPTPGIASEPDFATGAGLPDGSFVFSLSWQRGTGWAFYHFPADGSAPRRVNVGGDSAVIVSSVGAMSDPRRVLVAKGLINNPTIGVVELATGKFTPIRDGVSPQMVGPDALLFADRGGVIWVQRVDFSSGKTLGAARRVADNVFVWFDAQAALSASRNGTVVWGPRASGDMKLSLTGSDGVSRTIMSGPKFWEPRFSPDGRRISFARYLSADNLGEMWLYDLRTQTDQRVSTVGVKGADVNDAVWSPDGRTLAVSAYDSAGGYAQTQGKSIWLMRLDGSAPMQRLTTAAGNDHWTAGFTPDGKNVLYVQRVNPADRREIWMAPVAGGDPKPLVQTAFNVGAPRVSPDGQWLAFDSDETGTREVYVQHFPGPSERIRVSRAGGRTPVFTRGGREMVYWEGANLVSVSLQLGTSTPVGARRIVMPVTFPGYTEFPQFDVTADGNSIVAVQAPPPTGRVLVLTSVKADGGVVRQ